MSFQVGDKVKCIYCNGTGMLTIGKVYEVLGFIEKINFKGILVKADTGYNGTFRADKFELINTKELI
jgi:hypothetical protein